MLLLAVPAWRGREGGGRRGCRRWDSLPRRLAALHGEGRQRQAAAYQREGAAAGWEAMRQGTESERVQGQEHRVDRPSPPSSPPTSSSHIPTPHTQNHTPSPTPQDDDPYVRKTAAVCVAKLYDINPELVEDRGFLDMLRVREEARGVAWRGVARGG